MTGVNDRAVTAAGKKLREITVLLRNFLADWVCSLLPRARRRSDGKSEVLLVRLDSIGDFVLWLDSAAGLRALYPSDRYRLVLLGNALWTDLALDQPFFDEVIPVHTGQFSRDLRYRLALWRRLRGTAWLLAINPAYSRHLPFDDAVIRVCGAKERIGFQGDCSNQRIWEMWISNRWYTRLIPAGTQPLMELERNAEFIRGLGLPHFHAGLPELEVTPEPPAELAPGKYFVLVPGAGRVMRQWPAENFAALVQRVWDVYRIKAVICGAPGEEALGRRIRALVPEGVDLEDRTGTTMLPGFAAIIKGAEMVIANESSAVHIAAAVGTKSVCLVGGGHFGRFVPYRIERETRGPMPLIISHRMDCYHCNWNCRYDCRGKAAPCVENIALDDVWRAVQAGLDTDIA